MTDLPRLMRPLVARRYLGGLDPASIGVAPDFYRGQEYYDRRVIDAKLDERAKIGPVVNDDADAALEGWLNRGGALERRP